VIPPDRRIETATIARALAPPAIVTFAATILLLFPPAQYSFYPQCPIFEYLHLECPGCGTTRALAALIHGRFVEALHFNALVILLLPVAAAYAIFCYYRFLQRRPQRWPQTPPIATYFACVVAVLFTIVRNLPLHFF
jgi:hypothetical protein